MAGDRSANRGQFPLNERRHAKSRASVKAAMFGVRGFGCKFAQILEGAAALGDAAEQYRFAQLCTYKDYRVAAARFYFSAFSGNSSLTQTPGAGYEAAARSE